MMARQDGRRWKVLIAAGSSCYPKPLTNRQTLYSEAPPDPLMSDQEQLDDFLEALEKAGSPARNPVLRQALGWEEGLYEEVKAELVARGIAKRGRGRSDSVSLVGAEPVAPQTAPAKAPRKGKGIGNGTGWAVVIEPNINGYASPGAMLHDVAEADAIRLYVKVALATTWADVLAAMRAAGGESDSLAGTPGLSD